MQATQNIAISISGESLGDNGRLRMPHQEYLADLGIDETTGDVWDQVAACSHQNETKEGAPDIIYPIRSRRFGPCHRTSILRRKWKLPISELLTFKSQNGQLNFTVNCSTAWRQLEQGEVT
jgi:hypothetical protein